MTPTIGETRCHLIVCTLIRNAVYFIYSHQTTKNLESGSGSFVDPLSKNIQNMCVHVSSRQIYAPVVYQLEIMLTKRHNLQHRKRRNIGGTKVWRIDATNELLVKFAKPGG